MFAIEEGCGGTGDEELASVCVGSRVGHGQQTGARMTVEEVFVGEIARGMLREDARGARTISVDEVTTLDHEGFDLVFHVAEC